MRRALGSLFALPLLCSLATAQQVWTVGGAAPDFANLQTAIDTVADGDVLLLRTGTYFSGMNVTAKGLTIVADAGAIPNVRNGRIASLPAGKSVRLQGLTFLELVLDGCDGTVWVEHCSATGSPAVDVRDCTSVALLDVTALGTDGPMCGEFYGPGEGLTISSSSVHAYGSVFTGGDGGDSWCDFAPCVTQEGDAGIRSGGGVLMLSDCAVTGGGCSGSDYTFCDGDCKVGTCAGDGLRAGTTATHVLDSTLSGGNGYECNFFVQHPGEPYVGSVAFLPGSSLRVTSLAPARENTLVPLHLEGPPHSLVRLGASDAAWTLPALEIARGTSFLRPSPAATVTTIGVTNASGVLDTTVDVGSLPAGAQVGITFFQPYYVQPERPKLRRFGEPIEDVVLGQATMLVVLDESL
jgi:hypothetical protein